MQHAIFVEPYTVFYIQMDLSHLQKSLRINYFPIIIKFSFFFEKNHSQFIFVFSQTKHMISQFCFVFSQTKHSNKVNKFNPNPNPKVFLNSDLIKKRHY